MEIWHNTKNEFRMIAELKRPAMVVCLGGDAILVRGKNIEIELNQWDLVRLIKLAVKNGIIE